MILDADELEPRIVGSAHEYAGPIELIGCGDDRDPELDGPLSAGGRHRLDPRLVALGGSRRRSTALIRAFVVGLAGIQVVIVESVVGHDHSARATVVVLGRRSLRVVTLGVVGFRISIR